MVLTNASDVPLVQSEVSLQAMQATHDPVVTSAVPVVQAVQPATTPIITAVQPPTQRTSQLQVVVNESVNPGQHMAFTTPSGQRMTVPATEFHPAGTVFTVQYPSPPAARVASAQPQPLAQQAARALPSHSPVAFADEAGGGPAPFPALSLEWEDRQGMQLGWILYSLGCLSLCFAPCFGLVLWGLVAWLFYRKPAELRPHLPRQRNTARAAIWTLSGVATFACVALLVAAVVAVAQSGELHHRSWPPHHHWPHPGNESDKVV